MDDYIAGEGTGLSPISPPRRVGKPRPIGGGIMAGRGMGFSATHSSSGFNQLQSRP